MAFKKKVIRRKPTFKRSKRPVKKVAVKKIVRREIARNIETKNRSTYVSDRKLYFPAAAANFDSYNVIPLNFGVGGLDIVQGSGNGARIGNRIKVKKMLFRGTLVPEPYDATTNPIPFPTQWRVLFMYKKGDQTAYPTPATTGNIWDLNNGVYPFQNKLIDQWATINKDSYTVLGTRRFKLGYADSHRQVDGTLGSQNYANNDFKYNINFSYDVTKMIVKNQIFQDNSSESRSRQLFAVFIPSASTGGNPAQTVIPAELEYCLEGHYQDA